MKVRRVAAALGITIAAAVGISVGVYVSIMNSAAQDAKAAFATLFASDIDQVSPAVRVGTHSTVPSHHRDSGFTAGAVGARGACGHATAA